MKKRVLLLSLCWLLVSGTPVQAEEAVPPAALDWEISVLPKPSQEELERERWLPLLANDVGQYLFDRHSLQPSEADPTQVQVTIKTVFANPKVISSLNDKYKANLSAGDKVASSEMKMLFQLEQRTYALTEIYVLSQRGIVLEERKQTTQFQVIPTKSVAEAMYDIVRGYKKTVS